MTTVIASWVREVRVISAPTFTALYHIDFGVLDPLTDGWKDRTGKRRRGGIWNARGAFGVLDTVRHLQNQLFRHIKFLEIVSRLWKELGQLLDWAVV